jgi:hypothetical protein
VRGLRFPSHVIMRPVFFMENLLAPYSLPGRYAGLGTRAGHEAADDCGGRHRYFAPSIYVSGYKQMASILDGGSYMTRNHPIG